MQAIRMRADQIEQKAMMEEQKLRVMKTGGTTSNAVDQSIAVNDVYIDSIQAKLSILEKI